MGGGEKAVDDRAGSHGGLRSRAAWVLADSVLSSLTNAGLTIGLARVVSAGEYGAFALAFTLFSLVQSVSVAVNNQVVVILFSHRDPARQERAAAKAAAGAVAVGAASGGLMILGALLTQGPARSGLIAMGLVLPALMFQDHWRSTFIAFGVPRRAFVLDLVWAVLWGSAFVVLINLGSTVAGTFVIVWGLAALVAALLGARLARVGLDFSHLRSWFRDHREVSVPSLANTFASLGSLQLAFLMIWLLDSLDDLGALRGTQTLLGPVNLVGYAAVSFVVPEVVRRRPGTSGLILVALAVSALLAVVSAAWGTILLLLPDGAGRELLGNTWQGARYTLPGMVIYVVCLNATTGASAVMRALNRVRSLSILSGLLGPLVVVCSLVGVLIDGGTGAAYGFATAGLLSLGPWWWVLVRDARLGRRESHAA